MSDEVLAELSPRDLIALIHRLEEQLCMSATTSAKPGWPRSAGTSGASG
jgi:hypothetical protein